MSHHLHHEPAISDDSAPVSPAHRPTWWTVRTVRALAFACVGLAVALSLVSTLVSWRSAQAANARAVEVEQRLAALEEYVAGRGEFRDREAERLEREAQERSRQATCDLLDQLPRSPLLDVPRQKYACGPGVDLPADEQAAAAPPTSTTAPGAGAAATTRPPSAPLPAPARPTPPARTEPASPAAGGPATPTLPTPTATPDPRPPLVDLEPLTDPLCAVLGVCI